MEKIKSVLSGHKKSEDATHDTHTSAPGAHHSSETHPIYDQMTDSSTQPAATSTSTSAGQTATTGLGQTEQRGTGNPLDGPSAVAGSASRPGAGYVHEGMSEASIKSGIIGFGSNERQEHAALPSHHNPQANLDRDQVVGGGNVASAPTATDASEQPSTLKSALPLPGASTNDQPHSNMSNTGVPGNTAQGSTTRQPFEHNLRQESYTNDTDRSFPLAGGVVPKHDATAGHSTERHTASTIPPTQHTTSTHHPLTSEREPGTKEKDVGLRDGHGREGLAGAAAAATAVGAAAPLSQSHQSNVHDRGLDTREATHSNQPSAMSSTGPTNTTSHTTQGHHPDALAAATAAAAKSSTMSSPTHGQATGTHDSSLTNTPRQPDVSATNTEPYDSRYTDPGRPPGGRKLSYRHVPGGYPTPTPDDSKTFLFYRDQVVPEPGADGPVIDHVPSTRGLHHESHHSPESSKVTPVAAGTAGVLAGGLAGSHAAHHGDTVGSGTSTAGPHGSDTLNKLDPRIDSDLDSSRNTQGMPLSQRGVDHSSKAPVTGGALPASGQHELRHTGSLEQPEPRSHGQSDEHHYGRDAAIAGGVGAGAAGLGYAATHQHDTPGTTGGTLPQETSPYSSKQIDPRVLGSKAKLDEQRFDPQSKSVHSSTPVVAAASIPAQSHDPVASEKSTTGPHKSSLLNKLDPRVKNDSSTTTDNTQTISKQNDPKDHHARDAALVGGGAATAAGVHHSLQRNDTPGAGTAVLPNEQSTNTSSPLSGTTSAAPGYTSNTSAPLSSSTASAHPASGNDPSTSGKKYEPYSGPLTTSGTPFYGTAGAPAPIEGHRSSPSHQPASSAAPISQPHDASATHQDPQHHYGRDAALAGTGVATAGGLAYAGQHENKTDTGPASNTLGPHSSNAANVLDPRVQPDPSKQVHHNVGPTSQDPASKTIGPHQSNVANVLDPRVQPDPSKQKGHTTTGPHQSDTLNRLDPKVDEKAGHQDQHHLGRDAAVLGGTGAAGYGAYEAINAYGDHRSTQPGASMNEQRYDTSASGARAPNPVPTAGHYDYNNDHTSRNAGLGTGAALGAGALGGAAYAGSKHADNTQVPASSAQPLGSSSHQAPLTQNYPTQGTAAPYNTHSDVRGASHAPHDSVQEPPNKDHSKRDAAVLGTAGVAAAGGAAYAYDQNSDAERERARLEKEQQERLKKEQHDREKEQHKLDKEHSKQEKEAHKLEKEQHKHDKAVLAAEKQEHKHEKEQEKEAHRLEKEREKEAHRLEKEREKETGTPEKKHGILGFLHRDKSKKEKTSADTSPRHSGEVRRSVDTTRHSREYAAGGAALGAGTTAAAYDDNHPDSPRWKGKNLLHKDPPPGHPAREALEHHELGSMSGKREHVGVDGPIGQPDAISGVHETRHNTYGAEPLSQGLGQESKVIEPHTGLPMNVGRFGDGHGGTDGSATVHGMHEHGGVGARTTDWDAIKKADTPY